MSWQPTTVLRQTGSAPSSTAPAFVLTDQGQAVWKTMGNPEGPHALAREWIITRLAKWFGLATFDIALIRLTELEEISLGRDGRMAQPGVAVASRFETGKNWDGKAVTLSLVENPETVSFMVVFDTWVRNRDRHCPPRRPNLGNVFLSEEKASRGRFVLKAIDHTHCLAEGDLNAKMDGIGAVRDEVIHGLFPAFSRRIENSLVDSAIRRLREVRREIIIEAVSGLPAEWRVSQDAVDSIAGFLVQRASFLQDYLPEKLMKAVQLQLDGFDE